MSQAAKLNDENLEITTNNDSIIITHEVADLPGGATLDVSGVSEGTKILEGGHIIVKKSNGDYAPMEVENGKYKEQGGETIFGVLKRTITVARPQAAILTAGQVREKALPIAPTAKIKTALPTIKFV